MFQRKTATRKESLIKLTRILWLILFYPYLLTGLIFLLPKGLSRVFSSTTIQNHQFFGAQASLWSNPNIHTWLLEKPQLRARTLEAGQGLGRLAQHRAACRPGLCAIAPGRRAGAPPVWKLTRSFPVQACKHPPAASLFSPAFRA